MSDADFKIYNEETHKKALEAGFKIKKDYCPLLIAENLLIEAENNLIDTFEEITGIKRDDILNLDLRKKYLDLTLSLMSQYVGSSEALMREASIVCKH